MCDYRGYEFGACSYPSSVCVDGYLYDEDSVDGNGYQIPGEGEEKIPCPKCNMGESKMYRLLKQVDRG